MTPKGGGYLAHQCMILKSKLHIHPHCDLYKTMTVIIIIITITIIIIVIIMTIITVLGRRRTFHSSIQQRCAPQSPLLLPPSLNKLPARLMTIKMMTDILMTHCRYFLQEIMKYKISGFG